MTFSETMRASPLRPHCANCDVDSKRGENGSYEILDMDEITLKRIAAGVAEQGLSSAKARWLLDLLPYGQARAEVALSAIRETHAV